MLKVNELLIEDLFKSSIVVILFRIGETTGVTVVVVPLTVVLVVFVLLATKGRGCR